MPHHHRPTTIAILGADTVFENALSLLLRGAGYDTKLLEDPSASAANAEEQLGGVDLLRLTPSLREEDEEGFLRTGTPTAAAGVAAIALRTPSWVPSRREGVSSRRSTPASCSSALAAEAEGSSRTLVE